MRGLVPEWKYIEGGGMPNGIVADEPCINEGYCIVLGTSSTLVAAREHYAEEDVLLNINGLSYVRR